MLKIGRIYTLAEISSKILGKKNKGKLGTLFTTHDLTNKRLDANLSFLLK